VYEDYVDTITKAANEATTSHETVPLLKGYRDRGYARAWNQAFTAYPKNVGFDNGLSAPQPDFVQSFRQLEFEPFPIGEELDAAVLYNDDQNSIALPHFAGEWKGPGNDMDQAALQSAYDGAVLVHSRNEALAYMGQADPASHASVLTVTTNGRAVNVFGHDAAPSAGGDKLKYHQYRLSSAHMDESYHDFKKGRKQLRNAQDFAKEQLNHLRDQLQEYWKTHHHLAPACHTWSPPAAPHLPAADGGALPRGEVPGPSVPDPTEEEGAGYERVEPGDHSAPHALSNPDHEAEQSTTPSPPCLSSISTSSSGHKRKATSPFPPQLPKARKGPPASG
jgi:hypothetical protein